MGAAQVQGGVGVLNDPGPSRIRAGKGRPDACGGSQGIAARVGGLALGGCAYTWFSSSDTAIEARPICTLTFAGVGSFFTVLNLGLHAAGKRIRTSPRKP